MTFTLIPGRSAQSHAVIKRHVIANFSSFANDHTHTVIDKETAANFCAGMNFNAGGKAAKRRQRTRSSFTVFIP